MFILELDNMIRFDSKHTLFGQAGLVSDKKVVLSKQLREIATAVLDSGTAWRYYQANMENFLVLAVAVFMCSGTARMQRITSHGEITMADDPDHDEMQRIFWAMQFLLVASIVILIVGTRRFALRTDLLTCTLLFVVDCVCVVHINFYAGAAPPRLLFFVRPPDTVPLGYYLLSEVGIYGETSFAAFSGYANWKRGIAFYLTNDDDGWIVDDQLVDAQPAGGMAGMGKGGRF